MKIAKPAIKAKEVTDYDPCRWGFTFLKTDSRIPYRDKLDLMIHATEMYLNKEPEREVRGEEYEGTLHTKGNHVFVTAGFSGQRFDAEVHTNDGRRTLTFLVTEYINPELN